MICLLLAVAFGYLLPVIDYKLYNTFLGGTHLPPGGGRRVDDPNIGRQSAPKTALQSLGVFARGIADGLHHLPVFQFGARPRRRNAHRAVPRDAVLFRHARKQMARLAAKPYLKPWLTPALTPDGTYNATVTRGWFDGLQPGAAIPWGAWLVPLAVWMSMVLVSYGMMACLSVILRRQWAQNEALAFPLLRLPLEMVEQSTHSVRGGDGVFVLAQQLDVVRFWPDVFHRTVARPQRVFSRRADFSARTRSQSVSLRGAVESDRRGLTCKAFSHRHWHHLSAFLGSGFVAVDGLLVHQAAIYHRLLRRLSGFGFAFVGVFPMAKRSRFSRCRARIGCMSGC